MLSGLDASMPRLVRVCHVKPVGEILLFPVRISPPPRNGGMNEQKTTLLPDGESQAITDPAQMVGVAYDWAVEQFYEALYKFGFGLTGSESDAADLAQDTYRVLLIKGEGIRDMRKVKSWLFTTLYRQFLGRRRHATRFPETPVESAEWELPTISATQVESLDASFVVSALNEMEEKYRVPLAMFYLEELSYREIATVLEIPVGTIMSRLSRGKQMLRKRLETRRHSAEVWKTEPRRRTDTTGSSLDSRSASVLRTLLDWRNSAAMAATGSSSL